MPKKRSIKDISSKKVIHPYSRAALQLGRALKRTEQQQKHQREQKQREKNPGISTKKRLIGGIVWESRVKWFQQKLLEENEIASLTQQQLKEWTIECVKRWQEEVEAEQDKVGRGRRVATAKAQKSRLAQELEQEEAQSEQGIAVPDLTNPAVIKALREAKIGDVLTCFISLSKES